MAYYHKQKMKLIFKSSVLTCILLVGMISELQAQNLQGVREVTPPPTMQDIMQWHEVFTYEVRYSFFKLGEVKVEIVSDTLYNGKKSWYLKSIITSNTGIPFVGDEENHYNSLFYYGRDEMKIQKYWTDNVDEEKFNETEYIFNRAENRVYAYESEKEPPRDTLALEEPASSGQSLFYRSRLTAGTDTLIRYPVYLNLEKKYITLNHSTKTDMRGYEAFPEEVKTFYTQGRADIKGPFGFSGDFEAWYLANKLRIPVEARVNVWLGNVKIKLIDYKKEKRND